MIGIGIDISKNKSTVSAINDTGEIIMKPQEFKHSENELNKLIQWIKGSRRYSVRSYGIYRSLSLSSIEEVI